MVAGSGACNSKLCVADIVLAVAATQPAVVLDVLGWGDTVLSCAIGCASGGTILVESCRQYACILYSILMHWLLL
jgi:hypothetical protein